MKLNFLTILFFGFFVSYSTALKSQIINQSPFNYSIQNWDSFSSLESNIIRDVSKSDDGFLYLGTLDGLVLFDGLNFRKFTDKNLGPSEQIFQLFKEASGRIYVVTKKGVFSIQNEESSMVIEYDNLINTSFIEKSPTETFIYTSKSAYYLLDGAVQKEEEIPFDNYYSGAYFENDFILEADNSLILGSENHKNDLKDLGISFFSYSDGNSFYFNNQKKELFKYSNNEVSQDRICELINSRPYRNFIQHKEFSFATYSNSLRIIDKYGVHDFDKNEEFNPEHINDIYCDDNGIYWVATETNGFYRIERNPVHVLNNEDELSNNLISAVIKDGNQLLIGYNCGGIEKYNSNSVEPLNYVGNGCVWSIGKDSTNLWIGTYNGGLIRHSPDTTEYFLDDGKICKAIFTDKSGKVWFGTSQGLYNYNGKNLSHIIPMKSSPFTIFERINGTLLIGATNGYYQVNKDQFTFVPVEFKDDDNLVLYSFLELHDGNLLIGTNHGLFLGQDNQYLTIPLEKFSIGEKVYSLFKDKNQNIYISGNKGLTVINHVNFTQYVEGNVNMLYGKIFAKKEGLLASSFFGGAQNTFAEIDANTIAYASLNGLAIFDHSAFQYPQKHPTKIVSIKVDGDFIEGNTFTKEHGQFPIEIDCTTPYFYYPDKLSFEYKINDDEWVFLGNNRTIHLANLAPGNYTIRIRSNYTSKEAKCSFEIKPNYYQTVWFKIVIAGLVFFILFLVSNVLVRRVKRKEIVKRDINNKIAALEVKAFQSKLNPHFIFNCLNSIQSLFLSGEDLKANKYLSSFSTLMRKVLDSSDKIYTPVEDELATLELYLSLEQLQFSSGLEYYFEIDDSIIQSHELIPANILQPFIENSIKHGISGIDSVGQIKISISEISPDKIKIKIVDNGIGIEAGKKKKNQQNLERESKGMKIIEDRLEVLRNIYNLEIELNISTSTKPLDDHIGTEVSIIFNKIKVT